MMRSLYSGISGLRNHQTRMDVIGNNIANVNTIGYKSSRVVFADLMSQTSNLGSANTGPVGGTNPLQIGLGMRLSTVNTIHTPAPQQNTFVPTDVMINGDGLFVVQSPDGGLFYTRAGNFEIDNEGYLVTSQGYYVLAFVDSRTLELGDWPDDPLTADPWEFPNLMALRDDDPTVIANDRVSEFDPEIARRIGHPINLDDDDDNDVELVRVRLRTWWTLDEDGEPILQDPADADSRIRELYNFSVGADGTITVLFNNINTPIAQLAIAVFSNYGGLEKAGGGLYRETRASGEGLLTESNDQGAGEFTGGALEMSNVDLSAEFTDMIVTQRGFQANSRIITVSDTMLEELVNLKR